MATRGGKTKNSSRRLLLSGALAALCATAVSGCLSPTLPLPPPSRPSITSPDEEGNIRITGVVQSRATVFAHNLRTNEIVGELTDDTGRYDLTMGAEVGDRISVWQTVNTDKSASTEVIVPEVDQVDGSVPPPAMGGSTQ